MSTQYKNKTYNIERVDKMRAIITAKRDGEELAAFTAIANGHGWWTLYYGRCEWGLPDEDQRVTHPCFDGICKSLNSCQNHVLVRTKNL